MKAHKCDRCKRYYDNYDYVEEDKGSYMALAKREDSLSELKDIDLCERCHKSLQEWLKIY